MPSYIRSNTKGGSYFFTVVTYQRRPILCDVAVRQALRDAIEKTRITHPFVIDGWVLMPDHLHCIWTLPVEDADFSIRWKMIKRSVSIACRDQYHDLTLMNSSKHKHRESTLWQRRFWEHQIRDEDDFAKHMDYLHFNPVKHGYVSRALEWPHSTFHRYVQEEVYRSDWGLAVDSTSYRYISHKDLP